MTASVLSRPDPDRETPAAGIETCESLDGLGTILQPDIDLVTWRRALPGGLAGWLERLPWPELPDMRILVRPADLRRAVEPLLHEGGMPAGAMRDHFVADMDALVAGFARIARLEFVDVRLSRIRHDSCWKFHRDCVDFRLLTTYRGLGTEWVRPDHAAEALREQQLFAGPIERLRAHDVALFKGSLTGTARGVVHRSPPIAGTGPTRLLLCLNGPSAASPGPWPPAAAEAASPASV